VKLNTERNKFSYNIEHPSHGPLYIIQMIFYALFVYNQTM